MPGLQKLNLAHVFHWTVLLFSRIPQHVVPCVPPLQVFKNSRLFYLSSSWTVLWTVPLDDFNAGDRSQIVACWFAKISYSVHAVFFSIRDVLVPLVRSSSPFMSARPSQHCLHHSLTCCTVIQLSLHSCISWEWTSIGQTHSANKNWTTLQTALLDQAQCHCSCTSTYPLTDSSAICCTLSQLRVLPLPYIK